MAASGARIVDGEGRVVDGEGRVGDSEAHNTDGEGRVVDGEGRVVSEGRQLRDICLKAGRGVLFVPSAEDL